MQSNQSYGTKVLVFFRESLPNFSWKSIPKSVTLTNGLIGYQEAVIIGAWLKENISLKKLDLRGNNLGPKEAEILATGLEKNTKLQHFNLNYNSIGSEGAQRIVIANRSLRSLRLAANEINFVLPKVIHINPELLENNSLEILDLSHNDLGDEGTNFVLLLLSKQHKLTHLILNQTGVGDKTAKMFGEILHISSLQYLNLHGKTPDNSKGIGPKGAQHLARG